jgi:hypothetical protein
MRILSLALASTLVVALVGYGAIAWWRAYSNHYDDKPFDRTLWLANAEDRGHNPRGLMAQDLVKRVLRSGMTKKQVSDLLGKPDAPSQSDHRGLDIYEYNVGNWGGCPFCPDVVDVVFDNSGKLAKADITEH